MPTTFIIAAGGVANAPANVSGWWFDVLTAALLVWGIIRGRKRGMSEELLSLLQILTIVTVCGHYHRPLGQWFAHLAGVTFLFAYLLAYAALLLLLLMLFSSVRRAVGEKLVGSDLFGRGEYWLGMLSGMIRYAGCVVVALAMLNAPVYTKEEIKAQVSKQVADLGSNFFPTPGQLQEAIMNQSFVGKWVKNNLESLLIPPTPSGAGPGGAAGKPSLKEIKEQELQKATGK